MFRRLVWSALLLAACGPASARGSTSPVTIAAATSASPEPARDVVALPPDSQPPASQPPAALPPALPAVPLSFAIRVPPDVERAIDVAALSAVDHGQVPGAVVAIGRHDGLVFLRAYGQRATDPAPERNDVDTIYDLASLTKAVATTTAIGILESRDTLSFDDPVAQYLPAFAENGKERVTIRQLLTHTSGLPAVDPLAAYAGATREEAIARILGTPLAHAPGDRVLYSDLGFIVLGELVAAVSGEPLDAFVQREILTPLRMSSSCYRCDASLLTRIAPTERAARRGGALIRGDVHDPRAFRLGGVAGNAGLFASAPDLARFAQMMLRGGELDGSRVLPDATVRALVAPDSGLTLGWNARTAGEQSAFRAAHGHAMSRASYAHSGWTGTWMRIDPESDLFAIVLSNDVHPDARGDVRPLSAAVESIVIANADRLLVPPAIDVLSGIDVERRDGFTHLAGAHVVLVTHDAARARDGSRTLDVLRASSALSVLRVLAPEHGMGSDGEGAVRDTIDARTALPVLGLFGRARTPTAAMLDGADTVVIDLVDEGVRFYTYASTMHEVLAAAARRPELRVVVLDRPNPLGGVIVEGPALDADLVTFVNHHPLPLRHGLTLGELARMLDEELALGLGERLVIVRAEGWHRADTALDIGGRWVPPSPNLPDAETALLYPAVALLEGSDLSVGRGTSEPFHLIGAPWVDPAALALASLPIEGVEAEEAQFTPRAGPHRGRVCHGVRIRITDRHAYRPSLLGLALVFVMLRSYPDRIDQSSVLPLVGSRRVMDALGVAHSFDAALALAAEDAALFEARRTPFLLYEATPARP